MSVYYGILEVEIYRLLITVANYSSSTSEPKAHLNKLSL